MNNENNMKRVFCWKDGKPSSKLVTEEELNELNKPAESKHKVNKCKRIRYGKIYRTYQNKLFGNR